MRSRVTIGTVAATLALAVGCSSAPAPSDAAVSWADRVCGAIGGFTRVAAAPPATDAADPGGSVRKLGSYLDTTSTALQDAIGAINAAGPAPVPGGDEYVRKLTETLTKIRAGFTDAKSRLATVDTSSAESVAAALPAVTTPLRDLGGLTGPLADLGPADELRAATDQAANCRSLRGENH
jgi:hypothetical protein